MYNSVMKYILWRQHTLLFSFTVSVLSSDMMHLSNIVSFLIAPLDELSNQNSFNTEKKQMFDYFSEHGKKPNISWDCVWSKRVDEKPSLQGSNMWHASLESKTWAWHGKVENFVCLEFEIQTKWDCDIKAKKTIFIKKWCEYFTLKLQTILQSQIIENFIILNWMHFFKNRHRRVTLKWINIDKLIFV